MLQKTGTTNQVTLSVLLNNGNDVLEVTILNAGFTKFMKVISGCLLQLHI